MTKSELIAELRALADHDDPEEAHVQADDLLLKYIDNVKVEEAFNDVPKWYA